VWPGLSSGVTRACTLGVGTVDVGTLGVGCVDIFGGGSVSLFTGVLLGAIDSKIAAKFFISCILSVPGCLNGVIGVGFVNVNTSGKAGAQIPQLPLGDNSSPWGDNAVCM
jgi:hypothetical protein